MRELRSQEQSQEKAAPASSDAELLSTLPGTQHLFEYLTRSQHYHFGYFEDQVDSLRAGMERLALLARAHWRDAEPVLDVGCGLGGTTALIAASGYEALGIDPNRRAIAYARQTSGRDSRVAFRECRIEDLLRQDPRFCQRFGTILCTEITQHFADLTTLMQSCRRLLQPSGKLIISDVVTYPALDRCRVPLHRRGAIESAAHDSGMATVVNRDITKEVIPTLGLLEAGIAEQEMAMHQFFGNLRPRLTAEVTEFFHSLDSLQSGFANGDLVYETWVFEPCQDQEH